MAWAIVDIVFSLHTICPRAVFLMYPMIAALEITGCFGDKRSRGFHLHLQLHCQCHLGEQRVFG